MTDAQREAAVIEALTGIAGPLRTRNILRALESAGFLLLHRDDVTENKRYGSSLAGGDQVQTIYVTRWEPITKEDVGPWTTQETP